MSAPMFAKTTGPSEPCRACTDARRVLVASGRPPLKEAIPIAMLRSNFVDACPICDQNPVDAPAWRRV